jgi:calcineurin-like phosphoesterase family protein
MSIVRFISDLHHEHLQASSFRGFSSLKEHDQFLQEQWNSVVNKRDVTYILGDLNMEKRNYEFLESLNGKKYVLGGNHDKLNHSKELIKYVEGIGGVKIYKNKYILTHIPIHPEELRDFHINIHGHLHFKIINDKRYWNVCCEQSHINFKPISLNELIEFYNG